MVRDKGKIKTVWMIEEYDTPEEYTKGIPSRHPVKFEENLFLNEGINNIWNALAGATGLTPFNNTNSQLGVGDSSTIEGPTQTDLLATTNKLYKGMEVGYPQYGTNQKMVFRSVFGEDDANFAWREFTVRNGATALINLNRKVSDQGTKLAGQTRALTLELSLS